MYLVRVTSFQVPSFQAKGTGLQGVFLWFMYGGGLLGGFVSNVATACTGLPRAVKVYGS